MQISLLIPYLAPPTEMNLSLLSDLSLPALLTLLARSRHTQIPDNGGMESRLCQYFGIGKQTDWPIAPITFLADGGDPADYYWLRADPVHLRATRDQLMLVDSGAFAISQAEAELFAEAFNLHFHDDGYVLYPLRPNRWYLRLNKAPDLTTHSVNSVTGKHINAYLPGGKDALDWHRFYNEIQMLFFSLGINNEREVRGDLTINGLWCWGGGIMPTLQAPSIHKLLANDSDARAMAFAAGVPNDQLPSNAFDLDHSALVILDGLSGAAQYGDYTGWRETILQLEAEWFAPLLKGLKSGKLSSVEIMTSTHTRALTWHIRRKDLLKIWRRSSLTSILTMPVLGQ